MDKHTIRKRTTRGSSDVVRAGKVRVGLFPPFIYTKDPATGELRGGPGIEIARALAACLGVEVVLVEHSDPPMMWSASRLVSATWRFVGRDRGRAAEVGFSPPYLQTDLTYLVPAVSPVRRVADADQPEFGSRSCAITSRLRLCDLN